MIIQRQYVPFRILIETDPRSEAAIDKGFYDPTMPKSESKRLKMYNLNWNNSLDTIEMGSGVPYPDRMAAEFKKLDILYPYDNGFTTADIKKRDIHEFQFDSNSKPITKVTAYDKHGHVIAVDYYGDPYEVAKAYDDRRFLFLEAKTPDVFDTTQREFVFFWHEYQKNGYLSNWFDSLFTIEGVTYQHMEQYIMAKKALLFGDLKTYAKIMTEKDPAIIKKLGRNVTSFNENIWFNTRREILRTGLLAKFKQNGDLLKKLFATGDAILAEASPYDRTYGIGLHADDELAENQSQWKGENLLGYTLMEVRDQLKTELMMENIQHMWSYLDELDRPAPFYLSNEDKEDIRQFIGRLLYFKPENLLIV